LVVEFKRSSAPEPTRGFWQGLQDLGGPEARIVAPVREGWPLREGAKVVSLSGLLEELGSW